VLADGQRGSATVEFALVLPVLLVVTLALVQIGIIARDQLLLVGVARAAAREAAVSSDASAVRSAGESAGPGLDSSRMSIEARWGASLGDVVSVDASYDVPLTVPLVDSLLPPSVHLSASAAMRQEFEP
jgi:hypothetical protein